MPLSLSDLLLEKYLEWQKSTGERKTLKEFAEYIGMGQPYLNLIMNKHRSAGEKTIAHLSNFFRDQRFYDAIGLPRPDPNLQYIIQYWSRLTNDQGQELREKAATYITGERKEEDAK